MTVYIGAIVLIALLMLAMTFHVLYYPGFSRVEKRCYKKALSADEAFRIMGEEGGTHFDPRLIRVLIDHRDEWIDTFP